MDPESGWSLVGVGVGLAALAFTSAVDAALTAISRQRLQALQEENGSRAAIIARLLAEPYRFKAAILLLNAAAIIAATACTIQLTAGRGAAWAYGGLVVLLLLILIFGEALPKAMAIRNPARAARLFAGPMSLITRALWPLISALTALTSPPIRLLSGRRLPEMPLVTAEELLLMVNVGEEEGLIEPDEREMIEGIFEFGDTLVREVMIPRVDIVAIDETTSLDDALETVISHGHSRIPVYHETIDRIVGILYAKDLLPGLRAAQPDIQLSGLLRTPYFIPETMKVGVLLKDLQTRKVHVAIAVDEYGGTAGLVTIEDLLEEIVGDIQDEYDVEEPSIEFVGEGELIADARVPIDDLNGLAGLRLSSEESDRIGGMVYERLGRVPQVGDEVQIDDVAITVLSVEGLRPRRLRIIFPPPAALEVSATEREVTTNEDSG